LDKVVPHHRSRNNRDRFLLSVSWFHAGNLLGLISLPILALTIFARYARQLTEHWRWIYVVGASLALYFNVFVGIVQSFEKIPALKATAPTQSEPPFKLAQLVVLALFVVLTFVAAVRFRPEPVRIR
jgi:MFS family permease